MENNLKVSVIVPARNAACTLPVCLKAIRAAMLPGDELIVIDDASTDDTAAVSAAYADHTKSLNPHAGRVRARDEGRKTAAGDILLFVDADVKIAPDALKKVKNYFYSHPGVDAVTGLLSKEHPHQNFSSQYKNLYMHYIFQRQPENVTFLYGSIYAVRSGLVRESGGFFEVGEDTMLGQKIFLMGRKIVLLKDLEVVHLKSYNLWSLIVNDFKVPFYWGRIFIQTQGWKFLWKYKTGFSHAPKRQLLSIMAIAVWIVLTAFSRAWAFGVIPVWCILNVGFFMFFKRERGSCYAVKAAVWTFFDQIVMLAGICLGLCSEAVISFSRRPE